MAGNRYRRKLSAEPGKGPVRPGRTPVSRRGGPGCIAEQIAGATLGAWAIAGAPGNRPATGPAVFAIAAGDRFVRRSAL